MGRTQVRRSLRAASLGLIVLGLLVAGSFAADADGFRRGPTARSAFQGGQAYTGDFPDPSVLRVGSTYYAYATTIANKNLPVLTSRDLVHWSARPSVSERPSDNDAQPESPLWANWRDVGGHRVAPTWAPAVTRMHGRYVHAYATQVSNGSRFCVSLSYSRSAWGPFTDASTRPLVCPPRQGAIDPFLYTGPHGAHWLLWKTEGIKGVVSSRLWAQRLNSWATGFARHSQRHKLLRPDLAWERDLVENPAVVRYAGRLYLFYSANGWSTPNYAIGYAVCRSLVAPCKRLTKQPLVRSIGSLAGPGGESPFRDAAGRLRLAYHAWTTGQVGYPRSTIACSLTAKGCPQRRLHIGTLAANHKTGLLRVTAYDTH